MHPMEVGAEAAVAMSLDVFGDSEPEAAAWDIIAIAGTLFPPNEFLPFVPGEIVAALQAHVKVPPARPEDLFFVSSSVYSAKFFEGLTGEQVQAKIELDRNQRRQAIFDSIHRLHAYFRERDT